MSEQAEFDNKVSRINAEIDIESIKSKVSSILANDGELVQEPVIEKKTTESILEEYPDLTEFEKEQVADGWTPKGEKSAEEWARNRPLIAEIKRRGKEAKQLKKQLREQEERLVRIEKDAYDRVKQELLYAKQQATQSYDTEKANEIDKRLNSLQEPVYNRVPDEVMEFVERNKDWYQGEEDHHLEMRLYAEQVDNLLISKKYDPETHMAKVEKMVKNKFPNYFKNHKEDFDEEYEEPKVNKTAHSSEGFGVMDKPKDKNKYDARSLTEEQKEVLKYIERHKIMSKDEYIKQLNSK